jgi:Competence protein
VKLLGKRRRFLAAGLSVTAIGLYTILVGAEATVVRAALMGALALFGRQQDGLNSLGLVAALMALANPNLLWDVGFQLSFMATLGLVLYATPLTEAFLRLASRLEWRSFRARLPTGLDEDLCQSLLEDPGPLLVNALLVAGSGAAGLNPPEWLQAWDPQVVLLSVASGDRRARPAPEALQALQGRTLLRSDQNGWVHLSTDGEQVWVEVEIK